MSGLAGGYLDDLGADLKGAGAELLAGAVGVLPVDHADVGTASGGDHLTREKGESMLLTFYIY